MHKSLPYDRTSSSGVVRQKEALPELISVCAEASQDHTWNGKETFKVKMPKVQAIGCVEW